LVKWIKRNDYQADKEKKKRRTAVREKKDSNELQIAVAREGNIYIEPVSKKILNNI